MIWEKSNRFDRRAREIADRHYNRQKPGTPQFVPPGRCCVLYAENERGRLLGDKLSVSRICAPRLGGRLGVLRV